MIKITKEQLSHPVLGCPEERARADWARAQEEDFDEQLRREGSAYRPSLSDLVRDLAAQLDQITDTVYAIAEAIEERE